MNKPMKIIAETQHLRFVQRDDWTYVERANVNGVVCIVARTNEDSVLLVEQYRPPVGCQVIEFPAGLAGDLAGQANEALEVAAHRELLEETGYQAKHLKRSAVVASSAGITNEVVTMFFATGLEKTASGGGVGSEQIKVHAVRLEEVDDWLVRAQAAGKLIDGRVYAGLYFLRQEIPNGK